jgi:hypothetical protein
MDPPPIPASPRDRPADPGVRWPALFVLLGASVTIGGVAGLLSRTYEFPMSPGRPDYHTLPDIWPWILATGLALLTLWAGWRLWQSLGSGTDWSGRRAGIWAVVFVLLFLVALVLLLRLAAGPGSGGAFFNPCSPSGHLAPPPGCATTGPTNNTTQPRNATSPSPGTPSGPFSSSSPPPLSRSVLLLLFAPVVVAVVSVWVLTRHGRARSPRRPAAGSPETPLPGPTRLEQDLQGVRDALLLDDRALARRRIREAYVRLLEEVGPALPRVDVLTPREVEGEMARRWCLTSPASLRLRTLFEEARYSSHAMTAAEARQAAESLDIVLSELRSRPPTGGARRGGSAA